MRMNHQPRINKLSLINTLVQTELHNRMQEEQEMWRKHKKLKRKRERSSSYDSDSSSEETYSKRKKKMHKETLRKRKKNKISKEIHHKRKKKKLKKASSASPQNSFSNVNLVQQANASVSSGDRWGHDGFLELHPEAIISGNCFDSENESLSSDKSKKRTADKKLKTKRQFFDESQNSRFSVGLSQQAGTSVSSNVRKRSFNYDSSSEETHYKRRKKFKAKKQISDEAHYLSQIKHKSKKHKQKPSECK